MSRKRDKEFACLRFSEGRNIGIHNFNSPLPSENLLIYRYMYTVYTVVFENAYHATTQNRLIKI